MQPLKPVIKKTWFVLLLPVFFVLHGYMQNFPAVPLADALKLALEYFLISAIIAVIFYYIFKSWMKALLFSFYLMCFQLFFGMLHDSLKDLFPSSPFSKYSFLLPAIALAVVIIFIFLFRTSKTFLKTASYLNILFLLLIAYDGAMLVSKIASWEKTGGEPDQFIACEGCPKPNIYLIVLDEYAGKDALQQLFSFDNSAFEQELKDRAFFVASSPRSNYNYTPYSMASLFSMNYLQGITDKSNDLRNQNICLKTINDNELVRILRKFNYDFVNLSLFDFGGEPNNINHNNFYSTRERLISSQTLTGRIKKDLWYHLITTYKIGWAQKNYQEELAGHIRHQYDQTLEAASEVGNPKFVYTHFIMPHYPYLFDKLGRSLPLEQALKGGGKEYIGFLEYSNQLTLGMIDRIMLTDKTDPIIILMSDHGFTKYDPSLGQELNFRNMFNIRLPDNNYRGFTDSLTNVNVFRVLLNTQFNQQLPVLKDSSFFLKEY